MYVCMWSTAEQKINHEISSSPHKEKEEAASSHKVRLMLTDSQFLCLPLPLSVCLSPTHAHIQYMHMHHLSVELIFFSSSNIMPILQAVLISTRGTHTAYCIYMFLDYILVYMTLPLFYIFITINNKIFINK